MDEALVEREERGAISVLTMVYRPYNLLPEADGRTCGGNQRGPGGW
jgi:hypothetical protein